MTLGQTKNSAGRKMNEHNYDIGLCKTWERIKYASLSEGFCAARA